MLQKSISHNFFKRIEKNNGNIICFSYAVFNNESSFSKYNNYFMFSEILKLFNNYNKRLLCEWIYQNDNSKMITYSKENIDIIDYCYDADIIKMM